MQTEGAEKLLKLMYKTLKMRIFACKLRILGEKMTSRTYDYLVGWLSQALERVYAERFRSQFKAYQVRGLGATDKKIWMSRVLMLRAVVRGAICESDERMMLIDARTGLMCAYNGLYFELAEEPEFFLMELLKRTFRAMGIGAWYNDEYPAREIARNCYNSMRVDDRFIFVPNKRYIAFQNGVFDLEDGKLKKGRVEYRPYMIMDFDYMQKDMLYAGCSEKYGMINNPCRLWDKKITEIIPNKERREVFQQWCGSLLIDRDRYKQEYVAYLIGPGSNGKSVLANTIAGLFGEQYFSRFTLRQLFKDDFRNNRANLRGKIANLIDDMDERCIGGDDFKSIASGALLEARELYCKRTFKVAAPPILCCTNAMPESYDDSYGQHRRQLPIYTTTKVFIGDDRDPELTHKLTCKAARCYIFSWIYEGYKRLIANGGEIRLSDTVKADCDALLANSNNMRRWWKHSGYMALTTFQGLDKWKSQKEIMADYKTFADMEGTHKRTLADVCSMLESKGCLRHHTSAGWGYCMAKMDYLADGVETE